MEQAPADDVAIREFKRAHAEAVACEKRIKDLWTEYTQLDRDDIKAKKRILKERSVAVTKCGNLMQKRNVAEAKMIKAILASD